MHDDAFTKRGAKGARSAEDASVARRVKPSTLVTVRSRCSLVHQSENWRQLVQVGAGPARLCDTVRFARHTVNVDDLEKRMREFEGFHDLRVLPATWPVIRVDGRSFTRLSDEHFQRPFDFRFHEIMVKVAKALLVELQGLLAFTESDEISILLPAHTDLFGRKIEKLVSISAGIASSRFTREFESGAHFDSRVWVGPTVQHVTDYFRWRQSDATRCCLNDWCYWTLRKEGRKRSRGDEWRSKD